MKSRRQFLADVTAGASALLLSSELWDRLHFVSAKPAMLDRQALLQLECLHDACWQLANANQLEIVERILPTYLPKVVALARQSNAHQAQAARLASQSYILAAEIEKSNLVAMQAYAQQGVAFSQVVKGDPAIQTDALRQEATIALVAKQPGLALLSYQKALPFVMDVSPLLRSRIYLGLASAYARCRHKQEALRYLGLAEDHFPGTPEEDRHYLYLYSAGSRSVLHLYQALTYIDLQQPGDAWRALLQVDGLNPRLPVVESARIEFLNLQAQTAAHLGSLEESCTCLQASVNAATIAGYPIWIAEAADVYRGIAERWPHETQVKSLAELFQA